MTVLEICDFIAQHQKAPIEAAVTGAEQPVPFIEDTDVFSPEYMESTIQGIFEAVNRTESTEAELTALLQTHGFMSAWRRASENMHRTRCERWAAYLSNADEAVSADGALLKQLRNIGEKAEEEALS